MPQFSMPSKVIKAVGTLRRNFLWHGNKEAKGFNLVKWEIVQQNRERVWGSKNLAAKQQLTHEMALEISQGGTRPLEGGHSTEVWADEP